MLDGRKKKHENDERVDKYYNAPVNRLDDGRGSI